LAASLAEERGGRFSIAPTGPFQARHAYLDETNVLVTRFFTPGAELTLTDFMPALSREDQRRFLQPENELIRIVSCDRGEAEIEIVFDPRPDYARSAPRLEMLGKLGLRAHLRG